VVLCLASRCRFRPRLSASPAVKEALTPGRPSPPRRPKARRTLRDLHAAGIDPRPRPNGVGGWPRTGASPSPVPAFRGRRPGQGGAPYRTYDLDQVVCPVFHDGGGEGDAPPPPALRPGPVTAPRARSPGRLPAPELSVPRSSPVGPGHRCLLFAPVRRARLRGRPWSVSGAAGHAPIRRRERPVPGRLEGVQKVCAT